MDVSTLVGFSSGTDYQLKFDYKVVGTADLLQVSIGENNGGTSAYGDRMGATDSYFNWSPKGVSSLDIANVDVLGNLTQDGTWRTYTHATKFQLDGDDNLIFIGFAVQGVMEGDSEYVGIDNVTLVPEPATMSLLAIGGIGMLLKRRRR